MDKKELTKKILKEVGIVLAMVILPIIFLLVYASITPELNNIFSIIVLFVCALIPFYCAPWYLIHKYAKGKVKKVLYVLLVLYVPVISAFRGDYDLINSGYQLIYSILSLAVFIAIVVLIVKGISYLRSKNLKTIIKSCSVDDFDEEEDFEKVGASEDEVIDIDTMDGTTFEHFCADLLRVNGWTDVRVTPGSGDHGIDITAEKDDIKWGFQCKRWNGTKVDAVAVGQTYKGKALLHCDMTVIITTSTLTAQAESEAKQLDIKVWGRGKIRQLMDKLDNADNYYLSA